MPLMYQQKLAQKSNPYNKKNTSPQVPLFTTRKGS
jgi:hypothetical protein